ncbi:VWA domain-containing protein [Marinospirillum perlucidum]|uniref:VWA domain-containing protein n=1 Tax=Marinospirillum perlucidum TaxID=1982602 RepID=UPI0013904F5E|nr:VWA domain-containing protein [Marinospirillum perlucidum]
MKKIYLLLALIFFSLLGSQAVLAQKDVRVVVDISGSMKRTDPNNLRIPAAKMLVDLLPEQTQAGLWTFASQVNMLVDHDPVTEAWRRQARRQLEQINSVGLYTNIDEALETTTWDAGWEDAEGTDRHLILLSDGLVDVSTAATQEERSAENQASRDHLLRERLPRLVDAGFTIHTLALSDEADQDLMATLAQRSGGLHAVAYEADDLMPLLLQILNRLLDSDQVPLEGNRFSIDPLINEFTALVFHQPGAEVVLQTPAGERFDKASRNAALNWHDNARYTLITVMDPEAGEWQIETPEHPDNRVTVVSDLELHTSDFPATVYRGFSDEEQTLTAWFTEEGQKIDRREFLRLLDASARHAQDGQLLRETPMDFAEAEYEFQVTVDDFDRLGEQQLTVLIDGHTFQRQVTHSFNVQDVVAASLQLPEDGGAPRVVLRAQHPDLNPDSIDFRVLANGDPQSLNYRGDGEWQVNLTNLQPGREYRIEVDAQGRLQGKNFSIQLPPLQLEEGSVRADDRPETTPVEDNEVAEPEVIPNPAPQVVPSPVIPNPVAGGSNQGAEQETTQEQAPEEEMPVSQEEEATDEEAGLLGLNFSPIESWDDPRMLWVYIALGVANILLFLIAFLMYRRFIKRRRARHDAQTHDDEEEVPELDDLEFDLDEDLGR